VAFIQIDAQPFAAAVQSLLSCGQLLKGKDETNVARLELWYGYPTRWTGLAAARLEAVEPRGNGVTVNVEDGLELVDSVARRAEQDGIGALAEGEVGGY